MSVAVEEERRVFHNLDLLRGIAALAVAGHHLAGHFDRWLPASPLAVDLFFILSGLVVSHAYETRLRSNRLSLPSFFTLRVIRLYPLYLLGTLLMFALAIKKNLFHSADALPLDLALSSLAFAALFLPTPGFASFERTRLYPYNGPAWSLFWELIVNFAYALFIRRLSGWVLAAIILIGAGLLIHASMQYDGLNVGGLYASFWAGLDRVVFTFFCGVAIEHARRKRLLPRISLPAWASVAILITIFALQPSDHKALYDAAVVLIVFPMLVAFSLGHPPRWAVPICTKLGLASYAVYALQTPFLAHFAFRSLHPILEVGLLAILTGVALIADYFYDRPVRNFLSRRFAPRKTQERGARRIDERPLSSLLKNRGD